MNKVKASTRAGGAVGATAWLCGASPCACLRHGCRSLYIHTNQLNGTLPVGLSALTKLKYVGNERAGRSAFGQCNHMPGDQQIAELE